MSGSSTCRDCGRPIVWGKNESGKNVCVDPTPRRTGRFVLEATGTDNGRVVFAVRRVRWNDPLEQRRTLHFETCPKERR